MNIRIFFRCSIQFEIKKIGDLLLADLTLKTATYNRQATPHIYSLTLLKQINFTKQTSIKLAGNPVSLAAATCLNISIVSKGLLLAVSGYNYVYGKFRIS